MKKIFLFLCVLSSLVFHQGTEACVGKTLYIGVTSDLCSRIAQHREGTIPGFTKKYDVKILVWLQYLDSLPAAIQREKQLKEWKRAWKLQLIESSNPDWKDLYGATCE